jgi:hypothetical protein
MTTTLNIECHIDFDRKGQGSPKVLENGPPHRLAEPARVPRVARLMALAIRLDRTLRDGVMGSAPNWPCSGTAPVPV